MGKFYHRSIGMSNVSLKDFNKELERYGQELRVQIELECESFKLDPKASKVRVEKAKTDYQFFCSTYFPHYVTSEFFSSFQKKVFDDINDILDYKESYKKSIYKAPRGEAKSTYLTQLGLLYAVCTNKTKFSVILMDAAPQASEMLEAVKAELDTNPRLAMDFPKSCGVGAVWQATTIVTKNNVKVRVGGTGKRIRGMRHGPYRPDLIFLDDLENDNNVTSKTQRDKLEKWINSAVLFLGPPDGRFRVIYVGTVLHYDAVINRMSKRVGWRSLTFRAIEEMPNNMHLWEEWENKIKTSKTAGINFYIKNKKDMDAGAVISWDGVRNLYELMSERAFDFESFNKDRQNEAISNDTAPFAGSILSWTVPSGDWIYFGAIDPSMGKTNKSNDPSAILIGGYNIKTGVLDVVEAIIAKTKPDMLIAQIISLQAKYRCASWAVETVAFQEFFKNELVNRSAAANVAVPAYAIRPHTDKHLRILSIQPHIKNGLIRIHASLYTLIEQLNYYPEADHDDGPDALVMLWNLAQNFSQPLEYTPVANNNRWKW